MKFKLVEKETCPRCGEKFECSKSGKCWCYEVNVPINVLDKINSEYNSCLCPDCLKKLSFSPKISASD